MRLPGFFDAAKASLIIRLAASMSDDDRCPKMLLAWVPPCEGVEEEIVEDRPGRHRESSFSNADAFW